MKGRLVEVGPPLRHGLSCCVVVAACVHCASTNMCACAAAREFFWLGVLGVQRLPVC